MILDAVVLREWKDRPYRTKSGAEVVPHVVTLMETGEQAPADETVAVRPVRESFAAVSTWLTVRRDDHGHRSRQLQELVARTAADQSLVAG